MRRAAPLLALGVLIACDTAPARIELPGLRERELDAGKPVFVCASESSRACELGKHYRCERDSALGEFLDVVIDDCSARADGRTTCDPIRGCVVCLPGQSRCNVCALGAGECNPNIVQECDVATERWRDATTCAADRAEACSEARCVNACELAEAQRSYVGCEFYAADLDNAAIDDTNNASSQQYAVVVANPHAVAVDVRVERNDAAFGEPARLSDVARSLVPPLDLEVFALPRREVDGSSEFGLNDGTHTAVTSRAYRIRSSHPVTAYQFNPLQNVSVFSNDASLLLPTSAIGKQYSVVAWPQTIGNSDDPSQDFDGTRSDEDLRAFLTILGTADQTHLRVTLGPDVVRVVGAGPVPRSAPWEVLELDIGPFDVVNLETEGFNADFTGTFVDATQPVTVFVGSEASDVPMFGTYETRQCCADHLEAQLLSDATAGTRFIVARMPGRTRALNDAALPGTRIDVAEVEEPEWVRVVAIGSGKTTLRTTLPPPDDVFTLRQREQATLRAERDFILDADKPVALLQALPSQGVSGIPRQYPGGDPSILTVPPIEQYRRDYIFLTPDKYAFDFVTIVAQRRAQIRLDGARLPESCETSDVEIESRPDAGAPRPEDVAGDWVVHRCQLSFPLVQPGPVASIEPGDQHDGVHALVSDREMGIVVYGFDRFVSYAYVGGLNLTVLN